VLEHLDDDELRAGLAEMRRVLRPGGHLVGTVPARERLDTNTVVCPHCESKFHRWGHQRSFTPESLGACLDQDFDRCEMQERPFVHWPALNWKGKARGLLKLATSRFGVHGADESLVFVARVRTAHADGD